jgi:hypothetical protein
MDVSPQDLRLYVEKTRGRGMLIGGQPIKVLAGINPYTIDQDTIWYGTISPVSGDTTQYAEQNDLQNAAIDLKNRLLFLDSPYPQYYQATFADVEPFNQIGQPLRTNLHGWYKENNNCQITLYGRTQFNASTTGAYTRITPDLNETCIKQELLTNLICNFSAPDTTATIPLANKSILHEAFPSQDYTLVDKALARVWAQVGVEPVSQVYGLP